MKINNTDNINNYIIKNDIGEGSFGKLKLVIYKPTGEEYAMKIMNKQTIKEKMKKMNFKENEIIKKLHHINIVNCFELIENEENFYIIMEYCQNGELSDYIEEKKKLSEDESSMFFYQLINGVNYIHKKGFSHRDIKPENLLLTKDKILKIIDFGLSHEYDGNIFLKTKCGSPCYAAPEIIKGDNYDGFQIDVWCCGIVLYNMVCGDVPFEGETNKELFKKIIECMPEYPDYMSNDCKNIIKSILINDPKRRITIEKIKQSEFYLKGKKLCKINYSIDLDELDKKSYNIKVIKNIYDDKKEAKENKENSKEVKKEKSKENSKKISEINGNIKDKNEYKNEYKNENNNGNNMNDFIKIEIHKEIVDIKKKESQNKKDETDKNIIYKKINNNIFNNKEKNRFDILVDSLKKEEMINKYSIINTPINQKKKMNNKLNLFRQKTICDNQISENISTQKTLKNEEINYPNININNKPRIKSNKKSINDENIKRDLKSDFHMKNNNLLENQSKNYKLMDINLNKKDKNMNELSINNNNNIENISLLYTNQCLKLNKKIKLDNNNGLNDFFNKNSFNKIYLTANNTKNDFEQKKIIVNNSDSFKKFVKKIPPIKNKRNIMQKQNINSNDSKKNNDNNKKGDNKSLKTNMTDNNNIQRDNSCKPRINLNKIIKNYQSKNMLKNSFDLSNNNNKSLLQKEIFKNYNKVHDSNSNSINYDNNDNKISKTINYNINTNNEKNNKLEKIPQYLNNKKREENDLNILNKNIYNIANKDGNENAYRNNHKIFKIHKRFQSNEDRNKIKKMHKYKVAIKEFLEFIETSYTTNTNKLNSSGNNKKDFLPYL